MDAGHATNASTTVHDSGPRLPERGSRAAVILGNDALVAARPSTPAQLTHACRAAGFDIVVPPSCGDELVAGAYLDRLSGCAAPIAVACSCSRVQSLLRATPNDLQPPTIGTASPPVAAARYLRLVYGDSILVTYVGDCPSADDPSINARFSPAGFVASLERQGIALGSQPNEMPESESDRWRRYRSVPGGLPARRWLARAPVERVLREMGSHDVEARRWPTSSRANVLVDLADAASCACGGNRATIEEHEAARSPTPIVVAPVGLDLTAAPRPAPPPPPIRPSQRVEAIDPAPLASAAASVSPAAPRRDLQPKTADRPRHSGAPARDTKPPRRATSSRPAARRNRAAMLATIPAVVLMAVAALGVAAYALTSRERAEASTATGESSSATSDSAGAQRGLTDSVRQTEPVGPAPSPRRPNADSARRATPLADSSSARSDTTRPVLTPRPRRPRAPEVVPGWLPQGAKTWTPGDANRPVKPDSAARVRARPDSSPPA